jgi:hypothetical protein
MKPSRRFLVLTLVLMAGAAPAGSHKVRVADPALSRSLVAQGARVLADYDNFQVLEADETILGPAEIGRVQPADRFNFLELNSQSLDTRSPATRSLRKTVASPDGKRLHLFQFVGPIKPEWRQALQETNAHILAYIPQNAYLIYADAPALARIQARPEMEGALQWDGPFLDDYKFRPDIRPVEDHGKPQLQETVVCTIQLVVDPDANPVTLRLIDKWKRTPIRSRFSVLNYQNVVVALPADRLKDIAARPDVIAIQQYSAPRKHDERQAQIVAGNLTGTQPSGPGYLAWLAGKGFTQAQIDASGFVVDVSDSGIDNGTTTPGHFALHTLGDTARGSRVAYSRLFGTPNFDSTLQGCDGHGNLNAHLIAGYDAFSGFPHSDSGGFSYGLGVCPFVRIGASVVFDPNEFTDPDSTELQTQAYNSGARISNNSWGATNGAAYDSAAQLFDALVRDVGESAKNRGMIMVFVAGNEGDQGEYTVNSPGTAKNVITVGASESVRSLSIANGGNDASGRDACDVSDSVANSADDVIDFSSRGPCRDGRMKPDLVAPATHVTGGAPQSSPPPAPTGIGSALPCFDSLGICALFGSGTPGDPANFFPLNQEFYSVSSGSSHAAPAVSGACALLRQYFINQHLTPPSPAMTKAFLMNSARYLNGSNANDTLWSPRQGMGGLNLGTAFDGVARLLRDQAAVDVFTASGQTRAFSGSVADPTKPLRVTLAWTDAPGSTTAGQALVNDLDLTVTLGDQVYLGNVFNGAFSAAGGAADWLNNVESVFLPAGTSGTFTVTVTAANIAADGLAPNGTTPRQDFALVIYNTGDGVPLNYVPTAGSYAGLFHPAGAPQLQQSGAFAAKITGRGTYSGTLQLGANRYPFSGRLNSSGTATNSIPRKLALPLSLRLQMDTADDQRLTGLVGDGTWLARLRANRAVYSAKTNPAPFAGRYTVIIPGSGDPADANRPPGDGYGTVTVDQSGRVKLSGTLADGAKLTRTASVSTQGEWPLYAPLYRGQGQILGWQSFAAAAPHDPGGTVRWIKPPASGAAYYPPGFDIETNIVGSAYQPPATPDSPVLDWTSGILTLTGGDLTAAISQSVTIGSNNKVLTSSGSPLKLKLVTSTGLFKGTMTDPATGRRISFNGALRQNRNSGSGFFLGASQSGAVFLGPEP